MTHLFNVETTTGSSIHPDLEETLYVTMYIDDMTRKEHPWM